MIQYTFLNKKTLYGLILTLILMPFLTLSLETGIIDTDFEISEGYNLGILSGQNGWSGGEYFVVRNDIVFSGGQSVYSSLDATAYKDFALKNSGIQSFYLYLTGQITGANANTKETIYFTKDSIDREFFLIVAQIFDGVEWDLVIYTKASFPNEIVIKNNIEIEYWHSLEIYWNLVPETSTLYFKVRFNRGDWSDWHEAYDYYSAGANRIRLFLEGYKSSGYWDTLGGELPPPESNLTIIYPESGSEEISNFTMNIDYDLVGEDWEKIMIIFESWNIASVCPIYNTPEWWSEYQQGWFNYQSFPYFSSSLTGSGFTDISISNLDENFYNCVRCYFINEDLGTLSSEKCEDYVLTITGYFPPSAPLPFQKWIDYYTEHTGENFAEPTGIFTTIADVFDRIVQKLSNFINNFKTIFDSSQAETKGTELGQKIPLARGYLAPINSFFSGLPISELFVFVLLIAMITIIYRIIKTILSFVRGGGM